MSERPEVERVVKAARRVVEFSEQMRREGRPWPTGLMGSVTPLEFALHIYDRTREIEGNPAS